MSICTSIPDPGIGYEPMRCPNEILWEAVPFIVDAERKEARLLAKQYFIVSVVIDDISDYYYKTDIPGGLPERRRLVRSQHILEVMYENGKGEIFQTRYTVRL